MRPASTVALRSRLVAFVAAAAAVFGTSVLIGEAVGDGGATAAAAHGEWRRLRRPRGRDAGGEQGEGNAPDPVRGLAVAENGLTLKVDQRELPRGRRAKFSFTVVGSNGRPVRDFQVEHTKRVHLIVARRDLTGFQHLHPKLGNDGRWSTNIQIDDAGSYRVFADFKRRSKNNTLAGWDSNPHALSDNGV